MTREQEIRALANAEQMINVAIDHIEAASDCTLCLPHDAHDAVFATHGATATRELKEMLLALRRQLRDRGAIETR